MMRDGCGFAYICGYLVSLVSICIWLVVTKSNLGKIVLISSQNYQFHHEGTSGQELKKELEEEMRADIMQEWNSVCWLVLHCFLNILFFTTQDHKPRGGSVHSGLYTPSLSTKKMANKHFSKFNFWIINFVPLKVIDSLNTI